MVSKMKKLQLMMKDKIVRFFGLVIGGVYYVLYLYSVGSLLFGKNINNFGISVSSTWNEVLLKQRIAFMWEPFGVLKLPKVDVLLSLNMGLGLFLTFLIVLNFASVIYLYRLPKQCRIDFKVRGIWAVLPSFLTGFACCVPTFLIPLASVLSGITVFFIRIRPFLIPASILLLIWSIHYTLSKIPETGFE